MCQDSHRGGGKTGFRCRVSGAREAATGVTDKNGGLSRTKAREGFVFKGRIALIWYLQPGTWDILLLAVNAHLDAAEQILCIQRIE